MQWARYDRVMIAWDGQLGPTFRADGGRPYHHFVVSRGLMGDGSDAVVVGKTEAEAYIDNAVQPSRVYHYSVQGSDNAVEAMLTAVGPRFTVATPPSPPMDRIPPTVPEDLAWAAGFTSATGGDITTDGAYTVHTFILSDSGTPLVCIGETEAEVLVVGGGGGGMSGGGGAGGYRTGAQRLSGSMPVTVGAQGLGNYHTAGVNGENGGDSVFGWRTALGGGGGGRFLVPGVAGGSGGGGGAGQYLTDAETLFGGGGADDQGCSGGGGIGADTGGGGSGGGGGGTGEPGESAPDKEHGGDGGAGTYSDIILRGANVGYAGGGGGCSRAGDYGDPGSASHGGGQGSMYDSSGFGGTDNTGGGGGGGGIGSFGGGGSGGSGIVVVRYLTVGGGGGWTWTPSSEADPTHLLAYLVYDSNQSQPKYVVWARDALGDPVTRWDEPTTGPRSYRFAAIDKDLNISAPSNIATAA